MLACPPTPEWKRPDDLDLNGEAKQDDDDDNGDPEPLRVSVFFKIDRKLSDLLIHEIELTIACALGITSHMVSLLSNAMF